MKYLLVGILLSLLLSKADAQQKVVSGVTATQFMQFLADSNEHHVIGGLTPSGLKTFLAADEHHIFSGLTPTQFWKFLAEAIPHPKKKSSVSKDKNKSDQ